MTKKQILRIEVDSNAFSIVEAEAFLRRSTMKAIASEILSEHCSGEAIELAATRGTKIIKPNDHQKETPKEENIEARKRNTVVTNSEVKKPRLAQNQAALLRIKELWNRDVRPSFQDIANDIGYPKATVADNIKRMKGRGELGEIIPELDPNL
jgi:hypothetical protein